MVVDWSATVEKTTAGAPLAPAAAPANAATSSQAGEGRSMLAPPHDVVTVPVLGQQVAATSPGDQSGHSSAYFLSTLGLAQPLLMQVDWTQN
jgi:hypothetical protein